MYPTDEANSRPSKQTRLTQVQQSTCFAVDGVLKLPPAGTRQKVELRDLVEKVVHVGPVDPAKVPIA